MKAFNGITKDALEEIIEECEALSKGQKEAFKRFFEYVDELEEKTNDCRRVY